MATTPVIEVGSPNSAVPRVLDDFKSLFNKLDRGNLHRLPDVYSENIRFQDPFGSAVGLDQLTQYFAEAYTNVIACQFEFSEEIISNTSVAVPWEMHLRHKRIKKGQLVVVDGISHLIIIQGKVCYHRDYFDAGQLLYENLPVIGGTIRWIKGFAG
jgi:ketosteroid isomerase-like protein